MPPSDRSAEARTDAKQSQWMLRLLREFEGPLLRHASRFVPLEVSRDIVQEAFLRLWIETPGKLEGREKQWLFCVCRNLAIDALKKDGKLNRDDNDFEHLEASEEPIDQRLQRREEESELMKRLKLLNKNQEEVVRLKFLEGFSYKEISSVTGHSVSHVGVLIHEAMKILKNQKKDGEGKNSASDPQDRQGGRR